jgi:hypothetical protein
MSAQNMAEIVTALALIVAVVCAARWFRRSPRRWHHLIWPALAWVINEGLFVVVVIVADVERVKVAVNVWSLIAQAQGLATFAWYAWIMAHDDGTH